MSTFIGFNTKYQCELTEMLNSVEDALLNGNPLAYDEYKRLVGKRQGIIKCLEQHRELVMAMENYDDDRNNR